MGVFGKLSERFKHNNVYTHNGSLNKTNLPFFHSVKRLNRHINRVYGDVVSLNYMEDFPINHINYLSNIVVKPEHRNKGIGKNIINLINQQADDVGSVVILFPSLTTDGRMNMVGLTEDEKKHAEQYQLKLVSYYQSLGFRNITEYDEVLDTNVVELINKYATMIRFPNQTIPAFMK